MGDELVQRVRHVIGKTGENHSNFASRIGISADKLSKSLSGVRKFTSLELALIAETAETTVDWLLTGQEARTALGVAARKNTTCDHATTDVRAILGHYEQIIDGLARIQYVLPQPNLPPGAYADRLVDQGAEHAYAAASSLPGAARDFPVRQLARHCEDAFGVEIAATSLPDGLDGLAWSTDSFRLILVAQTEAWTRQRFTLAHELGHILARDAEGDVVAEKVMPGRSSAATEIRANAFAAEFLMPRDLLNSDACDGALNHQRVCELAWRYKVSPGAMVVRLKTLGVVSAEQQSMWSGTTTAACARSVNALEEHVKNAEVSRRGWYPGRLTEIAIHAYAAADTTIRPLAFLLGISADDLLDMLEPPISVQVEPQVASSEDEELAFTP